MKYNRKVFIVVAFTQAHLVLAAEPTFYSRSDGSVTVVEQSKNIFGNREVDVRRYPNKESAYQNEYSTEIALATLGVAAFGAFIQWLVEPSKPETIVSSEPVSEANLVPSPQAPQVKSEIKPAPEAPIKPTPRDAWKNDLEIRKKENDDRFVALEARYLLTKSESEIEAFNANVRAAEADRDRLADEIKAFKDGQEAPAQYR